VSNTELMSKTGRASGLDTQGTTPRNQAPQRHGWGVQVRTRKKIKSLLTRPTSLEMLKNSFSKNSQKLLRVSKLYKRFPESPRHFLSPDF
jgi:hypothetical protein